MDKIKIICDSASDLLAEDAKRYGICVMPVPIIIDGKEYKEGVDFTPNEFYEILKACTEIPKTAHISSLDFFKEFNSAYSDGYSHVLCVTIASTLSGMYTAALTAKEMFFKENPNANIDIIVYDSNNISYPIGQGILACAEMIQEGEGITSVLSYLDDYFANVQTFFSVFSLDFAKKSGRISCTAAFVGELIGLRPIIEIKDGRLFISTKVRGDSQVVPKLGDLAIKTLKDSKKPYSIVHGADKETGLLLEKYVQEKIGYNAKRVVNTGASVTSNSGPTIVGIIFS